MTVLEPPPFPAISNSVAARPRRWVEPLALAVILLLAAALRLWRLDELPAGVDLDEARNGVEVLKVLAGSHPLFFTAFDPREPVFIYSLSLVVRFLGPTALALHLTGAAWGLAGVVLTYPVARQWFGTKVALLATAGMAASLWDLSMSRWAERDITLPPLLLLFLFFLWRGFERRSNLSFVLAGVFASLCAYAYVAARILPVLIAALILGQWILARRSVSANGRGLVQGAAAGALTIAPLAIYFVRNPASFFGRIAYINSLGESLPGVASESVWQTARNTLGMFFLAGDANWRDGLPHRPVFVWWLAIPFALGVVWLLAHLLSSGKDLRQALDEPLSEELSLLYLRPCLWLALCQVLLLVPAFLARPSPQFDRTIAAAPSTYMLLAVGLVAGVSWLQARRRALGFAAWGVSLALLALLAVDTYRAYFVTWAHADPPLRVFEHGQVVDAAVLNERRPPPDHTFLFLGNESSTPVRYLAPEYATAVWLEDFSQLLPVPPSGPATYVFASPSLGGAKVPSLVEQYLPDAAVVRRDYFPGSDPAAAVFDVTDAQLRTLRGAGRPLQARFGDMLGLETVSVGQSQVLARPGDEVRLTLIWKTLAPIDFNMATFIHLVGADGKVVAQHDRQGLASSGWPIGQELASLHVLRLPGDLQPGVYRAMAGVDRRTTAQPSQALGELGAQVEVLRLEIK